MGNKPVKWIRLTLPVYSRAAIETVSTKKKYTNNLFVFLFLLYIFRLLLGPFAAALIQTTERQLMKTTVHNRARVCVYVSSRITRDPAISSRLVFRWIDELSNSVSVS